MVVRAEILHAFTEKSLEACTCFTIPGTKMVFRQTIYDEFLQTFGLLGSET